MLTLSHGKFLDRLKMYAKRTGTNLKIVGEEYTSKTCGKCGTLNEKLGSKKIFQCDKCCYEEDRDVNGSRNIIIKNIKTWQ